MNEKKVVFFFFIILIAKANIQTEPKKRTTKKSLVLFKLYFESSKCLF